jgi:hypothetical protein
MQLWANRLDRRATPLDHTAMPRRIAAILIAGETEHAPL